MSMEEFNWAYATLQQEVEESQGPMVSFCTLFDLSDIGFGGSRRREDPGFLQKLLAPLSSVSGWQRRQSFVATKLDQKWMV